MGHKAYYETLAAPDLLDMFRGTVRQTCLMADQRAQQLWRPGPEPIDLMSRVRYHDQLALAHDIDMVVKQPETEALESLAAKRADKIVKEAVRHSNVEEGG